MKPLKQHEERYIHIDRALIADFATALKLCVILFALVGLLTLVGLLILGFVSIGTNDMLFTSVFIAGIYSTFLSLKRETERAVNDKRDSAVVIFLFIFALILIIIGIIVFSNCPWW